MRYKAKHLAQANVLPSLEEHKDATSINYDPSVTSPPSGSPAFRLHVFMRKWVPDHKSEQGDAIISGWSQTNPFNMGSVTTEELDRLYEAVVSVRCKQ